MFSNLFDVIFPRLGDVFGNLTFFANVAWVDFFELVTGDGVYEYVNLFTGVRVLEYFHSNAIFGSICSVLNGFMPSYVRTLPVWCCMIYCSTSIFLAYYVLKFVVGSIL